MGASPTPFLVTSFARISIVFLPIPMWILCYIRRSGPPCLRAFCSSSPSPFIPLPRRCCANLKLAGVPLSPDTLILRPL